MNKKKALVTGCNGQDGSYLSELLLAKGYEVHGLIRRSATPNTKNIDHIKDQLVLHYGDLTDSLSIYQAIERSQAHEIYNLGAMSQVRISYECPEYTFDCVGNGAVRILEAIRQINPTIKYYQASSSEMFGKVAEIPQTEKTPFHPRSPYAVAKVAAYWATVNYRESYGIHASNGILFNHESERRGEEFVTRKITRAAARIAKGLQEFLYLGNLEAKRDWGHARDYVRAMHLMLQQETPDDYVVSTGETHSIKEFLDAVFGYLNLDWQKYVKIDPALYRPAEVDLLLGNSIKAKKQLGWTPHISFETLAYNMLQNDLEIAANEKRML